MEELKKQFWKSFSSFFFFENLERDRINFHSIELEVRRRVKESLAWNFVKTEFNEVLYLKFDRGMDINLNNLNFIILYFIIYIYI